MPSGSLVLPGTSLSPAVQCLAIELPAFIAFYRSRADFAGVDVVILEVKFPGGKTELQRISVTVGTGLPGRGI